MVLAEKQRKMIKWEKETAKMQGRVQEKEKNMSLQPENLPEIPEETARIAKILFPKENKYMWLRDEFDAVYKDEQFTSLYPQSGQLAEQP
jgi:hypothetical protein